MKFTMEEELIIKSLREFVEDEVKPAAAELEKTNEFPMKLWKRCVELGFIGVSFTSEYGGMGMRGTMDKIVLEEIGKECPALALAIDAHHLATRQIYNFGSKAQKEKYLPDMAFGEVIGAVAATEAAGVIPCAEFQKMGTQGEKGFIVNGTKIFCTNSSVADVIVVCGVMGDNFCSVIVDGNSEGLQRGGSLVEHKMGMHGTGTGTVLFNNVLVPYENVLVPEDANKIDPFLTTQCYLGISAISLGIAESVFKKTKDYLNGRIRNGKPLSSLQVVAHELVDMKCKIELMRSILYRTAGITDEGTPDPMMIHITKATVPEMACDVAEAAIKLHGGVGYMEATGIARYLRDAVCNTIGENPTNFHKEQIALQLGLPIETSMPLVPIVGDRNA